MTNAVNLLPLSIRRRELLRRRAGQWGTLWALAGAVALAVGGVRLLASDGAAGARMDAEQRQDVRLAKSQKRLEAARARLSALQDQEALLRLPVADASSLLVLAVVSRSAQQVNGTVHVEGFALTRNAASANQVLSGESTGKGGRLLTLRGIASDSLALAAFATGLRDAGLFASVERKFTGTHDTGEARPVRYLIECHF